MPIMLSTATSADGQILQENGRVVCAELAARLQVSEIPSAAISVWRSAARDSCAGAAGGAESAGSGDYR